MALLPHSLSTECLCGLSLLRPVSGCPLQGEGYFQGEKRGLGFRVGAGAGDVAADECRWSVSGGAVVTERLREGGGGSSLDDQCCPQSRKKREEEWAQGALWMSAGKETKLSSVGMTSAGWKGGLG